MKKSQKTAILGAAAVLGASFLAPLNVSATSKTAEVKVHIDESLSLTLSNNALNFDLEDENLHMDGLIVTAKTNAAAGYTISFNANNDYNDLKHSNVLVEDKIASIEEDKTEATFPETAWAYSTDLEDYTFKKIPLTPENIFATTEKGENTHDFTVGVRANNLAAGDYENELIFTAVANPEPQLPTLANITTMQEITPEICAASAEHETAQLKDTRDNKTYWVTKLKDNNCWMTQNLDYDLSVAANQTLTPATSNVTENRTVAPVAWRADDNSVYYMDGGDNYFANGTIETEGYSALPANDVNRHYAGGDYYSWKAATAGQGTTSITNADVNESICPAGWRLPTSNSADTNYSFGNLVKQYDYTGENQSGTTDATLLASPLFFARGGYVSSGSLDYQGSYGGYWSSRAYSISYFAYSLYFGSSGVSPSYDGSRGGGFSVRCVAL